MKSIGAGFYNEGMKVLVRPKYKILWVIMMGICLVGSLILRAPYSFLNIMTSIICPLISFMLVTDFFTAEQEEGSIRAILIRPVSHFEVFVSKLLVLLAYVGTLLVGTLVIGNIVQLIKGSFSFELCIDLIVAHGVSLLALLPIVLMAILISQLTRNSSSTFLFSILSYIGIGVIGNLVPGLYSYLFTSYTNWYKLFIGATVPFSNLLMVTGLIGAYSILLFSVGYMLFERRQY